MNKRLFWLLNTVALAILATSQVLAVETNAVVEASSAPAAAALSPVEADLNDLVTRINLKIKENKTSEADLADNIKEFDTLFAKHKEATPEDRAHILAMKGQLYIQIFSDPEKALAVFKQIKAEFPTLQINGNTDALLQSLEAMVEKKKIHDALAPGAKFPDFDEKDVEGKPLSVAKYKGKVVLVDFWATWCVPCIVDLPEVQKVYDKFHDKGFEIIGVSLDEDKERLQQFIKKRNMPWQQFFDGKRWENKLAVKYGVESTPSGFLIDRDGNIIAAMSHADGLEGAVAKALEK